MDFYAILYATICCLLYSLDSYSAHGKSFNGDKWAVLVAGSNWWINYRHQADVCHAYQILRKHGLPAENIITFMYDDIAHSPDNPYPGKIFNSPKKIDVYKNVKKDYTGEDVNENNLFNVLQGNETAMRGIGSGRVLKSGPNDHVFIYYADHGNTGVVLLPNDQQITYIQLIDVLTKMKNQNKFKELLFYMEACFSGSMFQNLPGNMNIYATTAASKGQHSFACYCDEKNLPCLGDVYSVSWLEDTETVDVNIETVGEQYQKVKKLTNTSKVCEFGDYSIKDFTIGEFVGNHQSEVKSVPKLNYDHGAMYPSHEHDFHYFHKLLNGTEAGSEKEKYLIEKIISTLVDMKNVKERIEKIAHILSPTSVHFDEIMSARHEATIERGQCFDIVLKSLINTCFTKKEKQHLFQHTQKVINLCAQPHLSIDEITDSVTYTCQDLQHEKSDLEENENCWMGQNVCHILCSAKGRQVGNILIGSCDNPGKKCVCQPINNN